MNKYLFIFILLISYNSFSQLNFKTYFKKAENGFEFLADNNEYCPVSVEVDLELVNLSTSNGNFKTYLIPARTTGFVITTLKAIKAGSYKYNSKTRYNYGDFATKEKDIIAVEEYIYNLPFKQGKKFKVSQGYNGTITHQKKNALDFLMPIGTDIYAAREGVVIKVVDHNTKTCVTKGCLEFNNFILIYHSDGTFSDYAHINTNSANVKPGDKVAKGQLIAKSGNIGWSTGPHLHFEVFKQEIIKRETLKTKFKINDGTGAPVYLEEKVKYYRKYE
ncbi:M23 family metallopeptidase [Polaribacter undariae]|uniref:M23 family metallopeptidase n=1 Tax=Polaribacter sejongensis TaxID=985043 RepID=A0AAJ1VG59_9FLAO|nr:M23 family metallopeptidase [Polaribacter undariae]MDN3619256.1 M23 family metallopeptidase [Polaribacter undariae]UWD33543.1 M23 family metallopeptidase [Polaribacter undariae]